MCREPNTNPVHDGINFCDVVWLAHSVTVDNYLWYVDAVTVCVGHAVRIADSLSKPIAFSDRLSCPVHL